jgi:hypothetical protein
MTLGGMANGISIEGYGKVYWTFQQQDGKQLTLKTQAYCVPKATSHLLSPQRLFDKENGVTGSFTGNDKGLIIIINDIGSLHIPYSKANSLPIASAFKNTDYPTCNVNLSIHDKTNQNLTGGQKTLSHWHNRFGHLNLQAVQQILRYPPFTQQMFYAAFKCDTYLLKCSICEYAKAHWRSISTKHTTNSCAGILKADHLRPGCQVSVDHFESRILGRTFDSFGKTSSKMFKGGCIFVDHASSYVFIEMQVGFSVIETLRAKQNFEQHFLNYGIIVESYLTDSGAFKANKFVQHTSENSVLWG